MIISVPLSHTIVVSNCQNCDMHKYVACCMDANLHQLHIICVPTPSLHFH